MAISLTAFEPKDKNIENGGWACKVSFTLVEK
jgi:hypothetical protein